ncbi:unnamed protein product [Heterobilharzia americana]|nr:unnamed protein product [Heterobilharzia americana]
MDSQSMHEMVPLVFLKDVDITVMASLPDELSSLPRILDDISRVLQRNSSSGCMDYAKTMCSVNNHNNLNHIGFNGIQESRQSGFSPSLLGNDGFTDDDKGHQSISSLHDQYPRHHHRHTPKSLSPHYTLHYNPGFHNPSIPGVNIFNWSTSDVSKPNLNDYDEPYISPESDCEANDDFTVSDHEIKKKKTQITDKFTFQCHSSLSITNGSESKSNSSSKERKTYDQKSISLDKLNHLDDEHIYDTVPSPSSSSSVSTEGLSSVNKLNRLDKLSSQSNQIPNNNNNNNDELLTSSRHQSLNTDKINSLQINNSVMLESKFNEQISSSSSSLSPTLSVSSSSSSLLMNKLTSSETVQYDEISEFSTTKSISPRLFPKQVTTANVVLTKPNIMSSSSVDSTKISKLTTHFRPRSSSRENTFDRNVNGYHFSFGVANTVKVNPSHCFPNHSSNKIVGSVGNDSVNSVYDTQMYRRNASTEQLSSHSSNSNSNIQELEGSCSPHLNTNNNNEQPSELAIEVARLRHELLLSRKDAMRAADRLSKQETEIYQLRQLLEQLSGVNSNDNSSVNLKAQNAITSQPSVHSNVNLHTNQLNNTYTNGIRSADSRKPTIVGVSSCLQNSMNTDSKVVDTVTATFKELDDAMARLELEQTELLREQARIRARIAATHRAQSIVNSTSPPSNKSTSRPKHFEMSIPKISINSRHHHELRSPGHMDYSNSQRIIRHMNKIHSEVKNIPK